MSVKEMSTGEIDSILTKVERLSTDDKKLRSTLDESIAAYAARHGGSSDNVDLYPALEAASLELWLDEDGDVMKRRASLDARLINSGARRTVDRCGEAL